MRFVGAAPVGFLVAFLAALSVMASVRPPATRDDPSFDEMRRELLQRESPSFNRLIGALDAADVPAVAPPPAAGVIDTLRLVGLIEADGAALVMLADASGAVRTARAGDEAFGVKIASVDATSVLLRADGAERRLRLVADVPQ